MSKDHLMATVERCSAMIIAIACVAAGYLFVLSLSGWDPENSSLFSAFQAPEWLHAVLLVCAVLAFAVCLFAMLLAVTVEARQIDTARQEWERRRWPVAAEPAGATSGANPRRGEAAHPPPALPEGMGAVDPAFARTEAGTMVREQKEG